MSDFNIFGQAIPEALRNPTNNVSTVNGNLNPLGVLKKNINSQTMDNTDYLNFRDEELNTFMHSPVVTNRLQVADDYEKEVSRMASIYKLSETQGIPIEEIMANYTDYARHYFGDDNPITNWKALSDMYNTTKLSLQIADIGKRIYNGNLSPEEIESLMAKARAIEGMIPPGDNVSRNIPNRMMNELWGQVPNYVDLFTGLLPIDKIQEGIVESKEEGRSAFRGVLIGLGNYFNTDMRGIDLGFETTEELEKFISSASNQNLRDSFRTEVPSWMYLMMPGGFALARWKEYSDSETGSLYYDLLKIEDSEGRKLNPEQAKLIAGPLGALKAAAESWSDEVLFGGGRVIGKLMPSAFKSQIDRVIATGAFQKGAGLIVKNLLNRGIAVTGNEIATELFQYGLDVFGNNLAISLDENKEFLQENKINIAEVVAGMKEVGIKTALATAPLALLGFGAASIRGFVNSPSMDSIVKRNIENLGPVFTTKEALDAIKSDPEFQAEIGKVPEVTIIEIGERKEALITRDFVNAMEAEVAEGVPEGQTPITRVNEETGLRSILDRDSDEFNVARETFKKQNFDKYFQTRELNEVELRKMYQETIIDFGLDQDTEGLPGLTYEQFRKQRFELVTNYINWRKTADAQKFLSTLSPAVEVIQRMIKGTIVDDAGGVLIKHSEELGKIVAEAKAGGPIQTIFDYNLEKDLQIEALESEIKKLQELGRVQKDQNRVNLVNQQIREYIEAKHELQSSRNELSTILELVARELFDENRILNTLAVSAENLSSRLNDIESPEYKKFLSGQIAIDKIIPKIKEIILSELNVTDEILKTDETVKELVDIIDKNIVELIPENVKSNISLEEEYKDYIATVKIHVDILYDKSTVIFDHRLNSNKDVEKTFFDEAKSLNVPKYIARYVFEIQEITEDSGLVAPIQKLSKSLKSDKKALFIARYIHDENFNKSNPYIEARLDFIINPSSENANRITATLEEAGHKRQSEILSKGIEAGRKIERTDSFRNLIIGVIQKSLSNFLKLNGERYIDSINVKVDKTISKPRADLIEKIQKAITLVDGVKKDDIDTAKDFITKNFYDIEGNPIESIQGPDARTIASSLLSSLEITFDENLDPVGPRLSLQDLIHLKTEVDLLRYLGKMELSEVQKGNLISDEIRKSEFLVYQKKIFTSTDKKQNLFKGVNFNRLQANQWGRKIFGKQGWLMFWSEYLTAHNESIKKLNTRSEAVSTAINDDKYNWGEKMYESRQIGNHEFPLQTLMFMYVSRQDTNIRTNLLYRTKDPSGNDISLDTMTSYLGEIDGEGLIDSSLEQYEKDAANVIVNDLRDAYDDIRVTFEAKGWRFGFLEDYIPLIRKGLEAKSLDQELGITMLRGTDQSTDPKNENFLLERHETTIENATEIRTDLWGIWQDYVQKQEHFINLNEWVRKSKAFINDKTIAATITENYDKSWTDGIKKYIDDVATPGRLHASDALSRILAGYKHNVALANLALKTNIILRQIPSALLYVEEAGLGNWMHAHLEFINPDNIYKDSKGKLRNKLVDFINEWDPSTILAKTEYEFLNQRRSDIKFIRNKRKFDKAAMEGINKIDLTVKTIGWTAIYNKYEVPLGREGAIKKAREWTAATQPSSNKLALPGMYRHSEMMNAFLMFTQQPVKLINHFTGEVIPNIFTKDGNKMAGFYGLTALTLSNLIIWSLTNRRVPDDVEDLAWAILAGGVTWIPGIGRSLVSHAAKESSYSSSQYQDPGIGVLTIVNPFEWKNAIDASRDGDMSKFNKQFDLITRGAGVALGVPSGFIINAKNAAKSVWTEEDWWAHLFLGGPLGEKK